MLPRYQRWIDLPRTRIRKAFVMQPHLAKQRDIAVRRQVLCCEDFVAVGDGICAGEKTERLAPARNPSTTGGEADPSFRERDPPS
jgi:hypothetical protein